MENLIQALKYISGGLKSRSLYPPGHPAIAQQVEKSFVLINAILESEKKLTIAMVDDVFIIQNKPFYEASELFEDFIRMFREKRVERVSFALGLASDELHGFYEILASTAEDVRSSGGLEAAFDSKGLSHILLDRLEKEKKDLDLLARKIYADAIDVMTHVTGEVRLGNLPGADGAKKVISEMVDVVLEEKNAILGLTMIKGYDDYLFNHSVNVSILAVALGDSLGFPESLLNDLGVGALLHDIGKVNTPEEIVKKPGKLDSLEWEIMKQHPRFGHDMLIRMKDINEASAGIALEHHLRYDMVDGYPDELAGRGTNPCSQVVTVADTYDAITTLRPYKEPIDPGKALEIMEKLSGTVLNPEYFKTFVKMLGIYPAGTLVRLDTNEMAIICKANHEKPLRPMVKILIDSEGTMLKEPEDVELTELDESGRPKRNIAGTASSIINCIDASRFIWSEDI